MNEALKTVAIVLLSITVVILLAVNNSKNNELKQYRDFIPKVVIR
jgi:hypothetical protein